MGEVYKAKDTRLDRVVAIKILPPHLSKDPERRQRFEREARTVSALNHPFICTLHDVGHQDGTDFLVLEYLEGENLAERLVKGPLPSEQVLRIASQIADALAGAPTGVIHRDLKPPTWCSRREASTSVSPSADPVRRCPPGCQRCPPSAAT
jgi:serine/threonine protein kinase